MRRRAVWVVAAVLLLLVLCPAPAHAWTPGTHIHLGESLLQQLSLLPPSVADLLRAFPLDFLYGSIAPDSSLAKHYAPRSRHSHAWHVGDELLAHAPTDALRAFGYGYQAHLAADTIAHHAFVPRQLLLTTASPGAGHAYWESRVEVELGPRFAAEARELLRHGHEAADRHMDRYIAPTIFSVKTNRHLFRGMVRVADLGGWQLGMRLATARTRWPLAPSLVEAHLARAFEAIVAALAEVRPRVRDLDPAGTKPLAMAKPMRRRLLAAGADAAALERAADEHYALPEVT